LSAGVFHDAVALLSSAVTDRTGASGTSNVVSASEPDASPTPAVVIADTM